MRAWLFLELFVVRLLMVRVINARVTAIEAVTVRTYSFGSPFRYTAFQATSCQPTATWKRRATFIDIYEFHLSNAPNLDEFHGAFA